MQTNLCTLEEEQISVVVLNVAKGLCYLHNEVRTPFGSFFLDNCLFFFSFSNAVLNLQANIIHFDIKAANILISKKSEIKLADFGVSEQLEGELNQADDLIGSPLW